MRRLALIGAGLLIGASSYAQSPTTPVLSAVGMNAAGNQLFLWLSGGQSTIDVYLQAVRRSFNQWDLDKDGVMTAADQAVHRASTAASLRASGASTVMRLDVDADGFVSLAEFSTSAQDATVGTTLSSAGTLSGRPLLVRRDASPAEVAQQFGEIDEDKDGRISFIEAANHAMRRSASTVAGLPDIFEQWFTLNPNGEERLTWETVELAARTLPRLVDADGDGRVSGEELQRFRAKPHF